MLDNVIGPQQRQDKTRQDKTRRYLYYQKYIILRPGTANSVANLGWPGNKIKNKQKTAVTIYKLNILGREEKKNIYTKRKERIK